MTSALDGGVWSASWPGHFNPDTHRIGCWVGPQSRSGSCGVETNLLPLLGIETRPPSSSLYRLSYAGSSLLQGTFLNYEYNIVYISLGARGSVVGWGTKLQDGRSPVRVPDEMDFFNLFNPSSRTMALGSTQPLLVTEMSTRNLPGGKKRPARRANNLAAIYEPNVWKCGSLNLSQL
jgi:hypothetical protein